MVPALHEDTFAQSDLVWELSYRCDHDQNVVQDSDINEDSENVLAQLCVVANVVKDMYGRVTHLDVLNVEDWDTPVPLNASGRMVPVEFFRDFRTEIQNHDITRSQGYRSDEEWRTVNLSLIHI